MKNHICLTLALLSALAIPSCEDKIANPGCNEITPGVTFTARLGEVWCIPQTDWQMTFGSLIEDSRCNIENVDCIWAGRFVMSTIFDNGEATPDTFYAVNNWTDTLYHGPYAIFLNKVYPLEQSDPGPLDPSAYSFDMVVK